MPRLRRKPAQRPTPLHPSLVPRLAASLLAWFPSRARDLPWRHTLDPYAIWIAEIMLQQTQVKTVIPYWTRWMQELPDIPSLAAADPPTVLKLWEGLGYYSRARNLQKTAAQLQAWHQGKFPTNYVEILALPGIGRYTAGAIASIAFDQPQPILDGNVVRVLTRLFGIAADPRERSTADQLWSLAGQFVGAAAQSRSSTALPAPARFRLAGPCSTLNQSLMELGATVCTPRQPFCANCPLQDDCFAHRNRRTDALPNIPRRPRATLKRSLAFLVEHRGRWLVRQRPAQGLNAELWEFPNLETASRTAPTPLAAAARLVLGFAPGPLRRFQVLRHSITRYRIVVEAHRAECRRPPPRPSPGHRWLTATQLQQLAWPSAHRRLLLALLQSNPARGLRTGPEAADRQRK